MDLDPGGIISWLIVGLLAGWIAGIVTRGGGFGCVTNIVIGVIGAFIGGLILEVLNVNGTAGFLESLAIATLGAVILLAIANLARR
ncbi:MAG TPA: GlsB/YeaQ/YmgE family stress response membrane protein [Thermomicrobiales bacterium]|nr:GlsB/YeaQ/YmgE family stress response membrane protein [Thermomicrobiales bacterium]